MSNHMIKMAAYVLLTPNEELGSMCISDAMFYGTASTKNMNMHLHQDFKNFWSYCEETPEILLVVKKQF